MKALTLEFLRFGKTDFGILREGDAYLRVAGDAALQEVSAPVHHHELLKVIKALRYTQSDDTRAQAIKQARDMATRLMGLDFSKFEGQTQLDLVLTPAELGPVPFECALTDKGQPLFLADNGPIVVTRRVRQDFTGHDRPWPARPNVLLISASPPAAGARAPLAGHKAALRRALGAWIEPLEGFEAAVPDERNVLTIVDKATRSRIRDTVAKLASAGRPVTHIHVLVHGCVIEDGLEQRFGLALDAEDSAPFDAMAPTELIDLLDPVLDDCVVATLAVCDSGSQTNSIMPEKGIAHELHARVPVVVASQFPLTIAGSTLVTDAFYGELFRGEDVRDALHAARVALHDEQDTTLHDWLSLVAYVRLPQDYYDHLRTVRLDAELAKLGTARAWADRIIGNDKATTRDYDHVARQLEHRISALQRFCEEHHGDDVAVIQEALGLQGSAYKRLAELLFERASAPGAPADCLAQSLAALHSAMACYEGSNARNIGHHWSGVQQLSLEAVLTGRIARRGRWHAACEAAFIDAQEDDELWAFGSLAELALLAPYADEDADMAAAESALRAMAGRATQLDPAGFAIESTRRQLARYLNWWTSDNGFFGNAGDVSARARALAALLQ